MCKTFKSESDPLPPAQTYPLPITKEYSMLQLYQTIFNSISIQFSFKWLVICTVPSLYMEASTNLSCPSQITLLLCHQDHASSQGSLVLLHVQFTFLGVAQETLCRNILALQGLCSVLVVLNACHTAWRAA